MTAFALGGLAICGQVPERAAAQSSSSASSASSSPFSGIFGGPKAEAPVKLNFNIAGDTDLEKSLRGRSLMSGAIDEGRYTGQDLLAAARADYARFLAVLYGQGYYSGVINITLDGQEAAQIAALDAPQTVRQINVTVQTGPQFRFSRAAVGPLAPNTKLPSDFQTGKVAKSELVGDAARAGVKAWRENGNAKADIAGDNIVADHAARTLSAEVALAPGPVVTFGQLRMRGYDRMDPRRLAKIAGFPEGQRFDPEKLEDVRKRLRRTGVFSAITLEESEKLGPGNTMDVDLTVVEQKPRRIGAGFEISTNEGAALSAYWLHRNLLGGGERLRIEGKIANLGARDSGRDYSLNLRLERPATITADTTAYLDTGIQHTDDVDYKEDAAHFGLGLNRIWSDELSAQTEIQYRVSRVEDESGKTRFKVLSFPTSITWDKRDDPNNAKSGFWLSGGVIPFVGFADTGSGSQLTAEGRIYRSFGEDQRFTLAARARLGTVAGPTLAETPRDYLFYSGGGGTVRGQPYQSLGVRVLQGPDGPIKTGGMSIATVSTEARIQVREKIGTVLFVDAGRVWEDELWGGASGWQAGAGVGVRYDTPIGPLRLDLAGPVGGDTGKGLQLYLGLGQAF
ncbi:autotransporter assembly complex protein TamA [Paracoccus pacificus]|uniref:Autotransporter assembly complex family protein n=1 Tax=Paracoccus pacificus TaxID=1463598 RepID=A0ABW4R6X1_9RHOB